MKNTIYKTKCLPNFENNGVKCTKYASLIKE